MGKYEGIIEVLASSDYYKAKKLINILGDKESFVDVMIPISNPFIYDRFTKMYEFEMYTTFYNKARNKVIRRTLLNQTDDNKLDYFKDINSYNYCDYLLTSEEEKSIENTKDINSQIEIISNRWLTEYIVYYFFQDSYYNFMTNLFQMVSYLGRVNKKLVERSHIDLYNEFRGLNNVSFKEKIEFFKKHMDKDYTSMFYDDMRKTKDDSYQELVNSSIKLNHDSKIYYKDISQKFGIDVYYLNGEEFYTFIKCFSINRDDLSDNYDHLFTNGDQLGYSFSYISDKNIGTVGYDPKKVTLMYDDIDYNKIMYVHHSDLHTGKLVEQNRYLTNKENEITTPNSLIAHTRSYNEIYIVDKPKPKALVCYDTITSDDIAFAKKYKLSILLMNREKYKHYETYDEDYMDNTYVI